MNRHTLRRMAAGVIAMLACPLLLAQEERITLPTNPSQWINSQPISVDAIKGKGVVLYFFEEG